MEDGNNKKALPTHAKVVQAKWGMAISLYNLTKTKEAAPFLAAVVGKKEVKAQDQVHISGTGWVKLIGEVS